MNDRKNWPRVKNGIDWELDEEATRLLMNDRKDRNVTRHSEKRDWLSPGQMYRRKSREINPTGGVPEKRIVNGLFKRAYNPNTRKTVKRDETS